MRTLSIILILLNNLFSQTENDILSVKDILDSADVYINNEIIVNGYICLAPEQMPLSLPPPVLSFYVLQDSLYNSNCLKDGEIFIKLYSDSTIGLDSLFGTMLCDFKRVIGYIRQIDVDYTQLGGSIVPFFYIEVNGIVDTGSVDVKNKSFFKKKDILIIENEKILYFLSKPSNLNLRIINAKGSIVKTLIGRKHCAGWHEIDVDKSMEKYFIGEYFIQLLIDGKSTCIHKLTISR